MTRKCLAVTGGILVLLAVASGFSYYLVDTEIPTRLTLWTHAHIDSPFLFLLLLNIGLLVVGCIMDMYAALIVIAPLVIPMGAAFGINPLHLGVVFIANLGLGFLTPPVGLSLLLASQRFAMPIADVARVTLSYFAVLLLGVLVITFFPLLWL